MLKSIKLASPLVSLVLLVGACGGGSGKEKASVTGQTTATTTSSTTAPGGLAGIVPSALLAQRCTNYTTFVGVLGLSIAAALDSSTAQQLEDLKAKMNLGDAPAEIKSDVAVITAYTDDLGKVLARYALKNGQYDPQAAAIAEFSRTVDTVKLKQATDHIDAWLKANCSK